MKKRRIAKLYWIKFMRNAAKNGKLRATREVERHYGVSIEQLREEYTKWER